MKTNYKLCITAFLFFIFYFSFFISFSQPVFLKSQTSNFKSQTWADSVFNSLSPNQRIGQLFMVAAYSNEKKDEAHIKQLIDSCGIGGLIFFQGGPKRQARLTNYYQSLSKVKLLIAI